MPIDSQASRARRRFRREPPAFRHRVLQVVGALALLLVLAPLFVDMEPPRNLRDEAAQTSLVQFTAAIRRFRAAHGRLPESLAELAEATSPVGAKREDLDTEPRDPWGHPWELRHLGDGRWEVLSAGPDAEFDTEDDLATSGR